MRAFTNPVEVILPKGFHHMWLSRRHIRNTAQWAVLSYTQNCQSKNNLLSFFRSIWNTLVVKISKIKLNQVIFTISHLNLLKHGKHVLFRSYSICQWCARPFVQHKLITCQTLQNQRNYCTIHHGWNSDQAGYDFIRRWLNSIFSYQFFSY